MTALRSSNTLVYAPEIKILIATDNDGEVDVSADAINFQVRRVTNSASQFACVLNNRPAAGGQQGQYTGVLGRMNRITVFLKRIEWVQVFSGYLDSVPGFALYANTCEIKATCTLKRLMNTYWDPGLASSQELLNQDVWSGADPTDPYNRDTDSGMGQMLGGLLQEVARWSPTDIHIQNIPAGFMNLNKTVKDIADETARQQTVELLKRLLGVTSTTTAPTANGGVISAGSTPLAITDLAQYTENFDGDGFDALYTGPFPTGSPDPVERWRPLATLALKQMGVDPSVITVFLHRIGVESTGNPNAINLTDSNAQAGRASVGILQCIPSTFRQYAISPYNIHIRSPFGSMCASLAYVKDRYKGDYNKAYGGSAGY